MTATFWLLKTLLLLMTMLALGACEETVTTHSINYQIAAGKLVYQDNCIACHGVKARGVMKEWYKPGADGRYPAPPLNGSAHTWLHDRKTLMRTINNGGVPFGGTMPSFKKKLTQAEKTAVLAYIQSLWPKEISETWRKNNG